MRQTALDKEKAIATRLEPLFTAHVKSKQVGGSYNFKSRRGM